MLKTIFDTLLKVTDPRPKYIGSRCLVEKNAVGGCDKCMTACPHDAVRITDHIEILEGACTGCGLCVQVCPTGALEYDLLPMLGALKDQGVAVDATPPVVVLTCSKVPGNAAHIECLGRVSPAMILASSAWGQELQLIRSDCATCKIGGPTVPESLENVLEIARMYRKTLGGEQLNVSVLEHQVANQDRPHRSQRRHPNRSRDAMRSRKSFRVANEVWPRLCQKTRFPES